ncbi:SusD/RagB family nutrient-binding outer membrane lipoprotein [Membranicola marinus]|uniref:SusD/RagB family nutrient-binding outer membrane lipoprotein n=1 Tax=Membranihabitans marinus TaxID=1227546 RepID=A0A953HW49_9BACT|nr:SusD/RagB family nutrient-binding outer membrane lipoprotein [Membranihabitans marinus]MBY5957631.1 SusD/RagB family nutrient-binding outer membrane lipoprotein [Membranihabitans marinus]
MKKLLIILSVFFIGFACDVDYENSPNSITVPPTSGLLNGATKRVADDLYDQWFSGRFTQVVMQYWTQTAYADEDRYVFRESQRETWEDFYYNLESYRKIIALNTDEETKGTMLAYGANENQIGVARILMSWVFNIMADTWGDIPYYSYGSDNANFQALAVADADEEILAPKYATQQEIYADILSELQSAAQMMDASKKGMEGDNIYHGDVDAWKRFANSLRLRIAVKIQDADPGLAESHINSAISAGVIASNNDNADFEYEANALNGAPMYRAYNVDKRTDFALGHSFVELLKGDNLVHGSEIVVQNPFEGISDPRLPIYAQPNSEGTIIGMPSVTSSAESQVISWRSLPGDAIINTPDFEQPILEYPEVCFLLSEVNNWDQEWYEKGTRASMENWGVSAEEIDAYIAQLPAASEETVLTQKYIALYMDPHTAWAEYRRTGYPEFIIKPGTTYTARGVSGDVEYTFTSLIDGMTDLPKRLQYPDFERTLNGKNRTEAVSRMSNGDALNSPLWWDK